MRSRARVLSAILGVGLLTACQQPAAPRAEPQDRTKLAILNTEIATQYMQNRDYKTALEKLEKALDLDPRSVEAHNTMGLLRSALGQFDQAEASFEQALRIEPDNSSALNNFGQFLCQRGRYADGEKKFLAAVANPLYKTPGNAYSNAGTCALADGRHAEAESYFRKALEFDQYLPPALLQMADLSLQGGHLMPARSYLQRYFAVARPAAQALWLGVQIERALGDRDAEASYALQLEKNFPDSAQTKLLLESRPP